MEWALTHKDEVVTALEKTAVIDRAALDHYLSLYANSDTASLQPDVARAVEVLLARGADRGFIARVTPEYAP